MIDNDVVVCLSAKILFPELVNVYGCWIGAGTVIGPFVEIQCKVHIGRRCRIQSHSFICSLVTIHDDVFIGHGVMFCNDRYPPGGNLEAITVGEGAMIGSNATILPGVSIGIGANVGAGSIVTKDVPDHATVVGNPAREIGND